MGKGVRLSETRVREGWEMRVEVKWKIDVEMEVDVAWRWKWKWGMGRWMEIGNGKHR